MASELDFTLLKGILDAHDIETVRLVVRPFIVFAGGWERMCEVLDEIADDPQTRAEKERSPGIRALVEMSRKNVREYHGD